MTFGHLIEYYETFLLKNHTKSVVEKVVPELFQQSKLSVSLDQYS